MDNKTIDVILNIVGPPVIFLLAYLVGSFAAWSFDLTTWHWTLRGFSLLCAIAFSLRWVLVDEKVKH